jgi:threonine dehydrogenase-like Zn-dependent dehydrogenase
VKQVRLDGDADNPLTAIMSFPHVMGHEVVGTVVEVAPGATGVRPGQRVAVFPWLACEARGLPPCAACREGRPIHCASFRKGALAPGMHLGTCRDAPGGFAPRLAAHASMLFPVPDAVSDAQAAVVDPCAVALHALLRAPPRPGEVVLVIGCGALGLLAIHLLERLFPGVEVLATDVEPHLAARAQALGAAAFLPARGRALVEAVAARRGAEVLEPVRGLPWLLDGVDRVYDTVGLASTLEVGLRVLRPRGHLVLVGVAAPRRFEWTPLCWKELHVTGASGCAVDDDGAGGRAHGFQRVLDLTAAGRIDPATIVTHAFPLARFREAFAVAADKRRARSVKVLFELAPGAAGLASVARPG